MKITILNDNIASNNSFAYEHGLSLLIQTNHKTILFDMGQSDVFIRNATALCIDLSQVDLAIISHGHYDHGGGLKHFLSINQKAPIYIHKLAFNDYYSIFDDTLKYIGLDQSLKSNNRIQFTNNYCAIDQNIQLFTPIEHNDYRESINQSLIEKKDNHFITDMFLHEQNLLINDQGKSFLFTGCSHRGIENITKHAIRMHQAPIDYIIGGFHLYSFSHHKAQSVETINRIAQFLYETQANIITSHCTGEIPYTQLKTILQERIQYGYAGQIIQL